MDCDTSTTRDRVHSGTGAVCTAPGVALFDSGSPSPFIGDDFLEAVEELAAASVHSYRSVPVRQWDGFGSALPLKPPPPCGCPLSFFKVIPPPPR